MYKIITIGGKDYKLEYSIQASLCEDFVENLTKYIMEFSGLVAKYDNKGQVIKTKDDALNISTNAIKDMMVANTTQLPKLVMTGFYAGLTEHQPNISKQEALDLYKAYLTEWRKTPTDVLSEIINKVNEDNFFAMIGLDLTKMKTSNKSNTKTQRKTTKKQ